MSTQVKLQQVTYPTIGFPAEPRPELAPAVFTRRLALTRRRMAERGLEALVVYGDREHYGTLTWLTNYDPRFEEALLVVFPRGTPLLFVGNEGMTYSNIARLKVERRLFQTFSLLGQPREKVRPLAELLRAAGIGTCRHVGTAGWKYFSAAETGNPDETLELPDYIATALRAAVRKGGRVCNETAMFMDPECGLRNLLEPEQIADFEWVATHNSESLRRGLAAIRIGMTEMEGFATMAASGMPYCCHPVCTTGERLLSSFMGSPTSAKLERGAPIFMTMAYQGANTCRFGWVARGPQDLPAERKDYVSRIAAPYFAGLAAWYETLCVGAQGDALHHAVWDRLTPLGFTLGLNIGHQIAADEWTHSMVSAGSTQTVRSGMYWQADFFPTAPAPYVGAFAEDGVVVADARLRATLKSHYPAMWKRFTARRQFMREQLGIAITDDLLPMSNFCGAVIPYFLSSDKCLVMTEGVLHG